MPRPVRKNVGTDDELVSPAAIAEDFGIRYHSATERIRKGQFGVVYPHTQGQQNYKLVLRRNVESVLGPPTGSSVNPTDVTAFDFKGEPRRIPTKSGNDEFLNWWAIEQDFSVPYHTLRSRQESGWPGLNGRRLTDYQKAVTDNRGNTFPQVFHLRSELKQLLKMIEDFQTVVAEQPATRGKRPRYVRVLPLGDGDELLNAAAIEARYGYRAGKFQRQQKRGWPSLDGERLETFERTFKTATGANRKQDFWRDSDVQKVIGWRSGSTAGIYVESDGTRKFNLTAVMRRIKRFNLQPFIDEGKLTFTDRQSPTTGVIEKVSDEDQVLALEKELKAERNGRAAKRRRFKGEWYIPAKVAAERLAKDKTTIRNFTKKCIHLDHTLRSELANGRRWYHEQDVADIKAAIEKLQNDFTEPPDGWKTADELFDDIGESNYLRRTALRGRLIKARERETLIRDRDWYQPTVAIPVGNGAKGYPILYNPDSAMPLLKGESDDATVVMASAARVTIPDADESETAVQTVGRRKTNYRKLVDELFADGKLSAAGAEFDQLTAEQVRGLYGRRASSRLGKHKDWPRVTVKAIENTIKNARRGVKRPPDGVEPPGQTV